jgi:hypothetical protein
VGGFPFPGAAWTQPNQQLARPVSMESARPLHHDDHGGRWGGCICTTNRLTGGDSIGQSAQDLLRRVTASIPSRASGKEGELKGDWGSALSLPPETATVSAPAVVQDNFGPV